MQTTLDSVNGTSRALPRLLEGVELLGEVKGSGLREPPYLIRRPDDQVVQLSRLLYLVAAAVDGTRDLDQIAERVSEDFGRRLTPDHVRFVLDDKLAPLGILAGTNNSPPRTERPDPLLGLRFRIPAVSPRLVRGVADLLRPLFLPPVVVAVLGALVAFDVWLFTGPGISRSVLEVLYEPTLILVLIALGWLSVAFHECGHAAACRYGGATPAAMGVGIYLIWPVFYTDVTDSYRLDRAGRVRVDLGGVYFNAVFALATAGAYRLTGFEPLVLMILMQQLIVIDQFLPWLRFDGYYVISDLIGVSDLFARIKPVLLSLVPGRAADPRATELKPWARAAIGVWIGTIVPVFAAMVYLIVTNLPRYFTVAWDSFFRQLEQLSDAVGQLAVIDALSGAVGASLLVIPWLGLVMTYLFLCNNTGITVASVQANAQRSRARAKPPPAPALAVTPSPEPATGARPPALLAAPAALPPAAPDPDRLAGPSSAGDDERSLPDADASRTPNGSPQRELIAVLHPLTRSVDTTLRATSTSARADDDTPAPEPASTATAEPPGPDTGQNDDPRPHEATPARQDLDAGGSGSVETYTIAEAARATNLTKKAIRNRVDRGQLRAVLQDGLRRIPRSELERAGLSVKATTPTDLNATSKGEPAAAETADAFHEVLDRLERQARELAELRSLIREAEGLRNERDRLKLRCTSHARSSRSLKRN